MYKIYVVFKSFDGKREAFIERVNKEGIAAEVRKEDGCIRYDFYFSEKDKNEILLIEEWASKDHQQKHLDTPHMVQFRTFKGDYIETTTIGEFELK